ncbi:hypothetical protein H6G33_37950 [Calothrix sp. FACHB-1219]|uniref:hypothetical protein n=1 Tax=Calothrix sp. FACHB-1219 TaxID=2692778 RepID=UPI001682B205|nr:hypothetical protein [Calothrix sp. FACHB-1219]
MTTQKKSESNSTAGDKAKVSEKKSGQGSGKPTRTNDGAQWLRESKGKFGPSSPGTGGTGLKAKSGKDDQ